MRTPRAMSDGGHFEVDQQCEQGSVGGRPEMCYYYCIVLYQAVRSSKRRNPILIFYVRARLMCRYGLQELRKAYRGNFVSSEGHGRGHW